MANVDTSTVAGFGDEWSRFDQSDLPDAERLRIFDDYFSLFPWSELPEHAAGIDVGCGSGRWAALVAPRVGRLVCVDASEEALAVARRNLAPFENVELRHASIDAPGVPEGSLDFGYSLGVLHHVPDTRAALASSVALLRRGAPFLVYLYYRFDNRPAWFRAIWRASDLGRRVVSRMPVRSRHLVTDAIAATVYLPLARSAKALERAGLSVEAMPLSIYRDKSFYTMRTDALDRFGTRLEQRFTRDEIAEMMAGAGLERIRFRDAPPYWCAIGFKR